MSYTCDYCHSESQSVSAMLACEERCGEEDLRSRQVWANFNPNHRGI